MNIAFNPNIHQPLPASHPGMANPAAPAQNKADAPLAQPGAATDKKGKLEAAGEVSIRGKQDFDDHAGIKSGAATPRQKLEQRLKQTTVQGRTRGAQKKNIQTIATNLDDSEDGPLREASASTVSRLRGSGKKVVEEELRNGYDPLQRYALLDNSLRELDRQEMPLEEKQSLQQQLEEMRDDVYKEHPEAIRKGLQAAEDLDAATNFMMASKGIDPEEKRALRFMYGNKGNGEFDSPLSAGKMAKVLQEKFGAENFSGALASLRSKMATDFRQRPNGGLTPGLWLAMSDANAFNQVQSTFAIASDMRRGLVERAHVLPKSSHAVMTVSLLNMVEQGKSKAGPLVAQIHDMKGADDVTKGRVYREIQTAIKQLPTTLWEKMTQRAELLEDLDKQAAAAHKRVPIRETRIERREKEWLDEVLEQRKKGKRNGLLCSVCREPQYETHDGVTCCNEHRDAQGITV